MIFPQGNLLVCEWSRCFNYLVFFEPLKYENDGKQAESRHISDNARFYHEKGYDEKNNGFIPRGLYKKTLLDSRGETYDSEGSGDESQDDLESAPDN